MENVAFVEQAWERGQPDQWEGRTQASSFQEIVAEPLLEAFAAALALPSSSFVAADA